MLLLRTRPPLLFFTNLRRVRVKKLSDFKEMGLWVLSGSLSSVLRERERRMGVDILMEEGAEERAQRERNECFKFGVFFFCLSREQGSAESSRKHTSAAQYNTPAVCFYNPPNPSMDK